MSETTKTVSQPPAPQLVVSLRGWQWFLLGMLLMGILFGGLTSCYQGRRISRWTGVPVHIDLPKDLASYDKIVSVSFHKDSSGETIKDLTYIATDGKLHSQEYNDWGVLQGEIIWDLRGQ